MNNKLKYITTALLLLLLSATELYAQKSSTAVMEVRVEVVSGSSVSLNSLQQLDDGWDTYSGTKNFKVGDFSISVPDGVQIISEMDEELNLSNGESSVDLSTSIHQNYNEEGTVTFEITGRNKSKIDAGEGIYSGKKTATIQYL